MLQVFKTIVATGQLLLNGRGNGFRVWGLWGRERERERASERASETREERREGEIERGREKKQEREKPSSTMGGFIPRTARTGPAWMPAN